MLRTLLALAAMAGPATGQYLRGVNLAGAEFGESRIPGEPGRDYTYNSEASFRYFTGKGLNLFRIPLRWERLQPQLRGPLDPANLSYLKQNIAWAKAYGARIIVDIHNYGRYKINESGTLKEYAIDNSYDGVVKVSTNDLADLWVRLSAEFKEEPGVYAYDLMNEPHDMGPANWKLISQYVLSAIRGRGDDKLILVPGDSWSSANRWVQVHGPSGWIGDPANNFVYEAHLYFDPDESGTYKAPYSDANADIGQTRLKPFLDWCGSNGVRGFLGEYGVPNTDTRWYAVLDKFLARLDDAGMAGTYWAAGEWWGNYALSVQPQGHFDIDRPQLATLQAHAGAAFFTTVSAASGAVTAAAPDSLASGYAAALVPAGADQAALLLDTRVELTDRAGVHVSAPLVFVSPGQINYLVPAEAPLGLLDVSVKYQGKAVALGSLRLEKVVPALFSANADGQGVAAAQIVRLRTDGTRILEPVAQFDPGGNRLLPAPIDFGDPSDRLFLELYGTGFRNLEAAGLLIGGTPAAVTYAGRQPQFPGLDQVNAELPRSLAGAGELPITFTADGLTANTVTLVFR